MSDEVSSNFERCKLLAICVCKLSDQPACKTHVHLSATNVESCFLPRFILHTDSYRTEGTEVTD
jgi:hypothetical protein